MVDASTEDVAAITINYGTHNGWAPLVDGENIQPPTGEPAPTLELSEGYNTVYVQCDFTSDAGGNITMEDASIQFAGGANSTPQTTFAADEGADDGSGSGTVYDTIGQVYVSAPASEGAKYTCACVNSIQTSRQFWLCGLQVVLGGA